MRISLAIALLIATASAQTTRTLTLPEAQKLLLQKNADLLITHKQTSVIREQLLEARSAWLPYVNGFASYTYQSEVTSITVPAMGPIPGASISGAHDKIDMGAEAGYPIFTGLSRYYSVKAKEIALSAQAEAEASVEQRLSYSLGMLYFGWELATKRVSVQQTLADQLSEYATQTQNRQSAGVSTSTKVAEAQARLAQAQADVVAAANAADSLALEIATITGISDAALSPQEYPLVDSSELSAGSSPALNASRPELIYFDRSIDQLKAQRNVVAGKYLPAVSGFFSYHYGKPGINLLGTSFLSYYITGMSLSWNLFDGRKTAAQKNQISANIDIVKEQKQKQADVYSKGIEQARHKLVQAQRQLNAANTSLAASATLVEDLQNQLASGTVTSLEYLTAVTSRTQAQFLVDQSLFLIKSAWLTIKYHAGEEIAF
jgi:outer membrane protein